MAQSYRNLRKSDVNRAHSIFVCGSQRSGTRLPIMVMERSPSIITYPEGNSRAFDGMFLKDDETIKLLLRRTPFPIVAFKPICESHRAPDFLRIFSESTIIWIYRDYRDTVNSAVRRFRQHGASQLEPLATGDLDRADWRAGGLSTEKLALVRNLYGPHLTSPEGHALLWCLRSDLFFDLDLHDHPRAFLVKYEDLVSDPEKYFRRLFELIGSPFQVGFVAGVYRSSIAKDPPPELRPDISVLCESVHGRLDEHYAKTWMATGRRENGRSGMARLGAGSAHG